MKKFTTFLFVISIPLIFGSCVKTSSDQQTVCAQEIVAVPCIDPNDIDSSAVCTTEYDPVCGCDEVTYSNSCVADKNGVQSYVQGECCD